jgi:cold shock CspA family protein
MRAQVKFFKSSKGYGFVKCPQGGTDFFFHIHDYCGGNSRKHAARMLKPEKMRFQVKGETAQQYIWNQHINVVVDIEQGKPREDSA